MKKYSSVNKPENLFPTIVQYADYIAMEITAPEHDIVHETVHYGTVPPFIIHANSSERFGSFLKLWIVTSPSISHRQQRQRKYNSKPKLEKEKKVVSPGYFLSTPTKSDFLLEKVGN